MSYRYALAGPRPGDFDYPTGPSAQDIATTVDAGGRAFELLARGVSEIISSTKKKPKTTITNVYNQALLPRWVLPVAVAGGGALLLLVVVVVMK